MNLAYYPGCALHGSSNDYEQSLQACLETLDVQLNEIEDWICCGATAAHSLNQKLAIALPARNLALAEEDGYRQMLAPCPMCSMQLLKARKALRKMRRFAAACRRSSSWKSGARRRNASSCKCPATGGAFLPKISPAPSSCSVRASDKFLKNPLQYLRHSLGQRG